MRGVGDKNTLPFGIFMKMIINYDDGYYNDFDNGYDDDILLMLTVAENNVKR